MIVQMIVELRGELAHGRQAGPRHIHEIMMLVVVANIEGKPVTNSVVGEGFLVRSCGVMFVDPASTARMKTNGKHSTQEHVEERVESKEVVQCAKKRKLGHPVKDDPAIDKLQVFLGQTDGLEQEIE